MLTLNLSSLGVSEASLERAILAELGMSREQAVKALADKFGVSLAAPAPATIRDGAKVSTDKGLVVKKVPDDSGRKWVHILTSCDTGEAVAQTLTQSELATLRQAATITSRLFATA